MGNEEGLDILKTGGSSFLPFTFNNKYFEFYPHVYSVKDRVTGQVLLQGKLRDGLYYFAANKDWLDTHGQSKKMLIAEALNFNSFGTGIYSSYHYSVYVANKKSNIEFVSLWHKRLGYPSIAITTLILRNCNIGYARDNKIMFCSSCLLGKSKSFPFSKSTTVYSTPLQIFSIDL